MFACYLFIACLLFVTRRGRLGLRWRAHGAGDAEVVGAHLVDALDLAQGGRDGLAQVLLRRGQARVHGPVRDPGRGPDPRVDGEVVALYNII